MARKKNRRQKWFDIMAAFAGGREPTCPHCGGHNFKEARKKIVPALPDDLKFI